MKILILLASSILPLSNLAFCQQKIDFPKPRPALEAARMAASIAEALNKNNITEAKLLDYPEEVQRHKEFLELKKMLGNRWREVLNDFDADAPADEMLQSIIVCALQYLTPEDYVESVQILVGIGEKGKISKKVLRQAISPSLRHSPLMIDNYTNPIVVDILKRAIKIYGDEPERVKGFQAILSGESKRAWDERRRLSKVPPAEGGPAPAVYLKNRGNAGE